MKWHLMLATATAGLLLAAGSANAACLDEIAGVEQSLASAEAAAAAATTTTETSPSAGTDAATGTDPLTDMLGSEGAQAVDLASQAAGTAGYADVAAMITQAKELAAAGKEAECMALVQQAMAMLPQ